MSLYYHKGSHRNFCPARIQTQARPPPFVHCIDCAIPGPKVSILKYDKNLENKGSVYSLGQAECSTFILILRSSVTIAVHRAQIM